MKKGVRRGDTISPKLYVATLESLFRCMKWKSGIKIDSEILTHLLFADNCVLFTESANRLRCMIAKLQRELKISLEINASKTKWMHNEFAEDASVLAEDKKN